jgi:hypothetical protein
MEVLLAVAAIGAIYYVAHQSATGAASSSASGDSSSSSGKSGSQAPPPVVGPPATIPAKPPGIYPAGTPGTYPLMVAVLGGDGYGAMDVSGGGQKFRIYESSPQTLWIGPGTWLQFLASVQGGIFAFGTAFDHFEGPNGVSSRTNPISLQVLSAGFVRAVFATFGIIGQ